MPDLYTPHRNQMKTGDLIIFSGTSFVSEVIRWKTNSPYSHVGMVLDTFHNEGFGQSIMVIESTSLIDIPDIQTKEIVKGVQLHWLSKRINAYKGSIFWAPLHEPLSHDGTIIMQQWLRSKHNARVSYDYAQAIGAGLDFFDDFGLENEPDFSTLFCSELVAKALQKARIISEAYNPSEMTPQNIVDLDCYGEPVCIKAYSKGHPKVPALSVKEHV